MPSTSSCQKTAIPMPVKKAEPGLSSVGAWRMARALQNETRSTQPMRMDAMMNIGVEGFDESGPARSPQGDSLLPRVEVAALLQPEKRLMLAIVEGAVSDFQKYATASSGRGRRLFAEADAWFRSTATERPVNFETICEALELDPSFIRAGLRRWCTARRWERNPSRTVLRFPQPRERDTSPRGDVIWR